MAKRVAEKELTDRNWDQEEETEEISLCLSDDTETASLSFILSASDGASLMRESSTKVGTFSVASEEVLKNRPIKKAKRRNVVTESEGGGAFKGFKGFVLPSGTGIFSGFGNGPGTKSFGLLSNGGSSSSSITNSSSLSSLKTASETEPTFSSVVSSVSANSVTLEKTSAHLEANGENPERLSSGLAQSKACNSESYHKQLAALNCSVRDWIVKHVNANPLCDLSPIFHDYEKYLAEIEQQGLAGHSSSGSSGSTKATEGQPRPTFGSSALQQGSAFFFNSSKSEDALGKKRESEKKIELKAAAAFTTLFSLDKSDSSDLSSGAAGSGFSFSPKKGGLFGKEASQAKVAPSFSNNALDAPTESSSHESTGAGEEEEEPPKVVINEVKEEDAFYSKKCKVFYKKDNEFKEKGVGTLHLKPASNQKTQLLIRADTNLGNILLNILVPPNMPCSRTGKNNVLIVCVPNPPIDEKNATVPLPILIRVKTSEDANELHKILLEKKEEV